MTNKIRILIHTDSASLTSGLANTTRNIFIPLLKMFPDKYEIVQLGFFHGAGPEKVPWQIIPTKMKQGANGPELDMADKYGEQSFDQVVAKVNPDIVFAYGDLWHMAPAINSIQRNNFKLMCYYTVDGTPYVGHLERDGSTAWGKQLARIDKLITLSHFGKETLQKSCPEVRDMDISVMYHPLNLGEFQHINDESKKELRRKIVPKILKDDAFIAGFIGRNQFRKQNYKLWELTHYMVHGDYIQCNDCGRITIKEWDHATGSSVPPGKLTIYDTDYDYNTCWHCKSSNIRNGTPNRNFYMWLHVPKKDPGYNCDLQQRLWKVESNCLYPNIPDNAKISHQELINITSVWDVFYYPTGGEGFGNPPFEAMACGVPILYANYSAHAEFCQFGGLPVRVANYIPELNHGINRSIVDTNHAIEQMLTLMNNEELRKELGVKGRMYTAQYGLGQMTIAWDKFFTQLYSKPTPMTSNRLHAAVI
jgi:glycosyltransferase involved in cell wall biosynthesis